MRAAKRTTGNAVGYLPLTAASAPTAWPRRWLRAISAAADRNIRQRPGLNWHARRTNDVSRLRPDRALSAIVRFSLKYLFAIMCPVSDIAAGPHTPTTCRGWVTSLIRPLIAGWSQLWQQYGVGGMNIMRLSEAIAVHPAAMHPAGHIADRRFEGVLAGRARIGGLRTAGGTLCESEFPDRSIGCRR